MVVLNLLVIGIGLGAVLGMMSLGFALSYWPSREFHFAFAGVVVLASYTYSHLAADKVPWVLCLVAALVVAAAVGVLCHVLIYRRLADEGTVFLSGFALSLIITNAVQWGFGSVPAVVSPPFSQLSHAFSIGQVRVPVLTVVELAIFLLVVTGVGFGIRRSRLGAGIRAVSSDAHLAQVAGVDSTRYTLAAYAVGSIVAAVAAVLLSFDSGTNPNAGFNPMLFAINGMLVGGARSFVGASAGGFLIGVVLELSLWKLPAVWQTAVAFVVLLIVVVLRPSGAFGKRVEA